MPNRTTVPLGISTGGKVVTLAPGERVTRPATKLIRRWRDLPVAELARAIEGRVPYAREDV